MAEGLPAHQPQPEARRSLADMVESLGAVDRAHAAGQITDSERAQRTAELSARIEARRERIPLYERGGEIFRAHSWLSTPLIRWLRRRRLPWEDPTARLTSTAQPLASRRPWRGSGRCQVAAAAPSL